MAEHRAETPQRKGDAGLPMTPGVTRAFHASSHLACRLPLWPAGRSAVPRAGTASTDENLPSLSGRESAVVSTLKRAEARAPQPPSKPFSETASLVPLPSGCCGSWSRAPGAFQMARSARAGSCWRTRRRIFLTAERRSRALKSVVPLTKVSAPAAAHSTTVSKLMPPSTST